MDPSFGARLRARREQQQVTLAAIAEQTKIKQSLLAALERDDVSHWPSGIFRRSYVRSYARAIGLEPDAVVREFLERYPDPADESAALSAPLDEDAARRRPPTRLRFLIASAIDALPALRPSSSQQKGNGEVDFGAAAGRGLDDYGPFLAAHPEPPMAAADEWTMDEARSPARVLAPAPSPGGDAELPVTAAPGLEAAPESKAMPSSRDELTELAALCGRIARTREPADLEPVLEGVATLLGATGIILWMWDQHASLLRPVLGHGYANDVLARLGGVSREADNALGAAFRAADARLVHGSAGQTGAVVVPLVTPAGCAGVLAFEFRHGREQAEPVKAFAAIVAAQLATLVG